MSNFEKASRLKLRFDTSRGRVDAESLWDIPLTNTRDPDFSLDTIAVALSKELKEAGDTVSFVNATKRNAEAERLQLRFDIVKHIIDVRLEEQEKNKSAQARREDKARIRALIAEKERENEKGKSVDELKKLLSDMKDEDEE